MSESRQHHWLSQCYLRNFAVELRKKGHRLQVFDRLSGEHFETTPRNVAGERDFNKLDDGQAADLLAVEKGYAAFEDELAPAILRAASAGQFPSPEDRNLIMNMIALFAIRNPRWREQKRSFHERIAKQVMDVTLSSEERWNARKAAMKRDGYLDKDPAVSYEDMKSFVRSGFRLDLNRGYQIGTELDGVDTILPLLAQRNWWMMRSPKYSAGFVTCDHPVSLMWSNPTERGGIFGPGFGHRNTQITFPLTSKIALVGAFELEEQSDEVSDTLVAEINGATIAAARRQVYSKDLNFRYMLRAAEGFKKGAKLTQDAHFLRPQSEDDTDTDL